MNLLSIIGGLLSGYAMGFSWRDQNIPTDRESFNRIVVVFFFGCVCLIAGIILDF